MLKTRAELYQILIGVFVGCLIISNVLAAKTFEVGSIVLPTAVIVFPIVYIVNDMLAEVYGFEKARQVIFLGFAVNLLAVISYAIAIILPAPEYATATAEAFSITLSSTGRVLVASFAAYIVGSLVNAYVMDKLKAKSEKHLMFRCVMSTLIGEGLDALIFISIAFIGIMPLSAIAVMIIAQATFKTVFEIIVYPITRIVINKAKTLTE